MFALILDSKEFGKELGRNFFLSQKSRNWWLEMNLLKMSNATLERDTAIPQSQFDFAISIIVIGTV